MQKLVKPVFPLKWFVLYTRSRFEKKVAERLSQKGIETFVPTRIEVRKWSDRLKKVERVLFGGYVFVRTKENELYDCLQDQGAVFFLKIEGKYATVRDSEIETIKRLLATGVAVEVSEQELAPGMQVEIIGGQLEGFTGECVELANGEHLIIRIEAIQQQLLVTIDKKYLKKIEA
ncbi:NusG antitermination factor [Nitritalea halalkaliphila LW7]|uniref:NusG antitermination factor n=1 Tax=Nitritalea halalkaliphila LW7 TaxID=1189621 RepID=I5C964_9BACT|nr:UpxY family transcription antiterminator [Nitritalea halalkaliphila]EIM78366.1 NusG antitermination factor [Nitritalea halalkaliphila LW7]